MDWNDHRDVTIQRSIARTSAELHKMGDFFDLHTQALEIKLAAMERVAYSLALHMESSYE